MKDYDELFGNREESVDNDATEGMSSHSVDDDYFEDYNGLPSSYDSVTTGVDPRDNPHRPSDVDYSGTPSRGSDEEDDEEPERDIRYSEVIVYMEQYYGDESMIVTETVEDVYSMYPSNVAGDLDKSGQYLTLNNTGERIVLNSMSITNIKATKNNE